MDRRQVEHVESHTGDVGQPFDALLERAVSVGRARRRAREELVPGREARALAVDGDPKVGLVHGLVRPVRVAAHERSELGVEREVRALVERIVGSQRRRHLEQPRAVRLRGPPGGGFDERGPALERRGDVRGVLAALEVVAPGAEPVHPCRDGVRVAAHGRRREPASPAVVAERRHRALVPGFGAVVAVTQHAGDTVVAVRERIGLDDDGFAHRALDGETAAVHLRQDALDDDSPAPVMPAVRSHRRSRGRRGGTRPRRAAAE